MGGASTKNMFSVFGLHHHCQINFSGGNMTSLTYSADGKKLKAVYAANTISPLDATTPINSWSNPASESVNSTGGGIAPVLTGNMTVEYVGNLIYENGVLKQMLVEGGYVSFGTNNAPTYHFYIQDHLGNNRVVVSQSGTVEQVNHYYPYGGLIAESTGWNVQRYKYNGKEFDRMHGLDWYDYGARWMDATLARWHSMDPLAEKYYDVSPYAYCRNNPLSYFDRDGREGERYLNKLGNSFQNVGLATATFGTATIIVSGEAEITTIGVSTIPSAAGILSGTAAIIAGGVTYTIGSALKAVDKITQNASSSKGKRSIDSGKNERHGDGGRTMNRPSTAKQLNELDAQIKNAKNRKERQRLEKKQNNIKREAQRKKHGEEHSRGSKR